MSTPDHGLTEHDIRVLQHVKDRKHGTAVHPRDCATIRRRFREGDTIDTIGRAVGLESREAVHSHLIGRCECGDLPLEPPIECSGRGSKRRLHCWADECEYESWAFEKLQTHYDRVHRVNR